MGDSPGTVFAGTAVTAEALVKLYHDEADGDSLIVQGFESLQDVSIPRFHELRLGDQHELFVCNSAVVLPDFLTRPECHALIEAADRLARAGTAASFYSYQDGLTRWPVRRLDLDAQMLATDVMNNRLLTLLEHELPGVAEALFERSSGLS